jgi:hypothetical protein
MNEINNFNINDDDDNIINNSFNEFIFRIPIDNNNDIFDTIESTLNELNNNINIINSNTSTNNDYIQFNIEFDYIQDDINEYDYDSNSDNDDSIFYNFNNLTNSNNSNNNNNNCFKTCNEINHKLCKSEKIKKNDNVLSEQCFICMDNYNENQFKRILPNCKHYFHKKCIDKWIKKNSSCPICRDQLLK